MDTTLYLAFAALIGMMRGAASLIIEHPLDVIKTYWQAYPDRKSFLSVANEIRTLKGWLGFYSGAIPNMMRVMLKQAYRYPLMVVLPPLFGTFTSSVVTISIATGVGIALLEVWVITPLERFKVWLMTYQKSSGGIKMFFKALRQDVIHSLYKGLKITAFRQVATWVTFFVVHDQLMIWVKAYNGSTTNMPIMILFAVCLTEGISNTIIVQPLDCIKTNQQKIKALNHNSISSLFKHIYNGYGVRGFYVGWEARMLQYMINSGFTVVLLESLRESFKLISP